jgi:hypothetical protein
MYPNCDFWSENMPSGNPASKDLWNMILTLHKQAITSTAPHLEASSAPKIRRTQFPFFLSLWQDVVRVTRLGKFSTFWANGFIKNFPRLTKLSVFVNILILFWNTC